METITLNNGVDMPALGLGCSKHHRTRPAPPSKRHSAPGTTTSTPSRVRQRAPGRRGRAHLGPGPVRGLPGDQDLDQRLWVRRDACTASRGARASSASTGSPPQRRAQVRETIPDLGLFSLALAAPPTKRVDDRVDINAHDLSTTPLSSAADAAGKQLEITASIRSHG